MAANDPDFEAETPRDSRLTSLDERLKRAEQVEAVRHPESSAEKARSAGWLVAQNLVGMPAGGFFIGFVLDKLFGTAPWIALGLMFTGFVGALWSLMRKQGS